MNSVCRNLILAIFLLFSFPINAHAQAYPLPLQVGLAANRPTYCPTVGQQYYATDTNTLSISTVAGSPCTWGSVAGGVGTVTTTGSPASGQLTRMTGATSISSSSGATLDATGNLTAASVTASDLTTGNCVQASTAGHITTVSGPCGTSSGTLTATGSPVSGNLTRWSGPTSLTNGDLSGDVTTAGTLAATVIKVNGAAVPTSSTVLGSNGSNQFVNASVQGNGTKVQLSTGVTTTNDCVKFDASGNVVDQGAVCNQGTVTSVALSAPPWMSVAGSPVTASGSLVLGAASGQAPHQVIGTCGAATSFAPCALQISDLGLTSASGTLGAAAFPWNIFVSQFTFNGPDLLFECSAAGNPPAIVGPAVGGSFVCGPQSVPQGYNVNAAAWQDFAMQCGTTPSAGHIAVFGATYPCVADSSPATVGTDGIHPGMVSLLGNTTAPTVPANSVGIIGPNSASFTSYGLQLPAAAPSGGQSLNCATPTSGVSSCSWGSGGGGGSGAPNQSVTFSSATSATVTVAAATANITWSCWDNAASPNAIYPSNVSVNTSTFVVTFTFSVAQSGSCVVNSSGSGIYTASLSGTTWSIPAATHLMGTNVLVNTYDSSGNLIFGNVAVDGSGNVTVTWAVSQSGKVVIAP